MKNAQCGIVNSGNSHVVLIVLGKIIDSMAIPTKMGIAIHSWLMHIPWNAWNNQEGSISK